MPPTEEQFDTDTNDNVPDLPPVLPGEELDDIEGEPLDVGLDELGEEQGPPIPPRHRQRVRARAKPEVIAKQLASRGYDFDDWVTAIESRHGSWEQPGVKVMVERLAPQYQDGVTVGGVVEAWRSRKPDLAEIMDKWGGGDFELKAQIEKMGQPPVRLRKKFKISGPPKLRLPEVPAALGGGAPREQAPQQPNQMHPMVEKRAMDIVSDVVEDLRQRANAPSPHGFNPDLLRQMESTYRATGLQVNEAVSERARAREEAAARQVQLAESRYDEMRNTADAARAEVERVQRETTEKIQRATAESQGMLGTLLPVFSENASRQVDSMTQTFMAREARIEAQHAKEVDSLYRQHEADMRGRDAQHQAEMTRMETAFQGQLNMMQLHFQQAAGALEHERLENTKLRDTLMRTQAEETQRLLKQADPIEKLQQLGSLRDVVGELLPNEGGDGLSDEAPDWMKMINSVAGSLGPAIGQILEARGTQAQQPQQLNPQQLQQLQYQQMLAAQAQQQQQQLPAAQQRGPAHAAGSREAAGAPQVSFERADVESAVNMLTSIMESGTAAADAAGAATKHLPHDMLREFARRTPGKVVDQLEAAGLLTPDLLTETGRQYMVEFLVALREIVK